MIDWLSIAFSEQLQRNHKFKPNITDRLQILCFYCNLIVKSYQSLLLHRRKNRFIHLIILSVHSSSSDNSFAVNVYIFSSNFIETINQIFAEWDLLVGRPSAYYSTEKNNNIRKYKLPFAYRTKNVYVSIFLKDSVFKYLVDNKSWGGGRRSQIVELIHIFAIYKTNKNTRKDF